MAVGGLQDFEAHRQRGAWGAEDPTYHAVHETVASLWQPIVADRENSRLCSLKTSAAQMLLKHWRVAVTSNYLSEKTFGEYILRDTSALFNTPSSHGPQPTRGLARCAMHGPAGLEIG